MFSSVIKLNSSGSEKDASSDRDEVITVTDTEPGRPPRRSARSQSNLHNLVETPTTYAHFLSILKQSPPDRQSVKEEAFFQNTLRTQVGQFVTWSHLFGGLSPLVNVKLTSWGGGRGLFVREDLKETDFGSVLTRVHRVLCVREGVVLTTYGGVLHYKEDWKKEKKMEKGEKDERWQYALAIHSLFLLDAYDYPAEGLDMAHYANHTSQLKCNARLALHYLGHFLPCIITLKNIPLGSEVLVHYSTRYNDLFPDLPCAETVSVSTSDEEFFFDKH